MKKIIIITAIIVVLLITATGLLIDAKKESIDINPVSSGDVITDNKADESQSTETITPEDVVREKTIDWYGNYNENDIIIEKIELNSEFCVDPISIPQIRGLKDKMVENKINESIKLKVQSEIKKVSEENEIRLISVDVIANFSNVISVYGMIHYGNDTKTIGGMNYNLINGEQVKFEDLFVKNTDFQMLIRKALYKSIEESHRDNFIFGAPVYDEEKGIWITEEWVDNPDVSYTQMVEYVPILTEHEINKIVKKFIKTEDKQFYFTNATIYIVEPQGCSINYRDCEDILVIYDKYLTNEKIYERDDIALKDILVGSAERLESYLYKKTNAKEIDNLFYDISIKTDIYDYDKTNVKRVLGSKFGEIITNANETLEQYKTIAKANPDKMHVVLIEPIVSAYGNLISITYKDILITCDITKKDEMLKELSETFTYYNLAFYMSVYNAIATDSGFVEYDEIENEERKENRKFYTFDVLTGEEIKDINQIFIEGVDYKTILENRAREFLETGYNTSQEIESMLLNTKYELFGDRIYIVINGEVDSYKSLFLNGYKEYLTIKEEYIIPESSDVYLNRGKVEELSEDELNRAYNEIFAKHGHDFKNVELKEYFNKMMWYAPIEGKTVTLEELSEIEKYNLDLIKVIISEK